MRLVPKWFQEICKVRRLIPTPLGNALRMYCRKFPDHPDCVKLNFKIQRIRKPGKLLETWFRKGLSGGIPQRVVVCVVRGGDYTGLGAFHCGEKTWGATLSNRLTLFRPPQKKRRETRNMGQKTTRGVNGKKEQADRRKRRARFSSGEPNAIWLRVHRSPTTPPIPFRSLCHGLCLSDTSTSDQ